MYCQIITYNTGFSNPLSITFRCIFKFAQPSTQALQYQTPDYKWIVGSIFYIDFILIRFKSGKKKWDWGWRCTSTYFPSTLADLEHVLSGITSSVPDNGQSTKRCIWQGAGYLILGIRGACPLSPIVIIWDFTKNKNPTKEDQKTKCVTEWTDWSVECNVEWNVEWSVEWSVECSVEWSVECSVEWSMEWSVEWSAKSSQK